MRIRIVKIGGSLLRRPDLLGDFQEWFQSAHDDNDLTLLIVGGGELINAVREWDALRPGDPAQVHWRCVEMLRFSFESMREAFERDPRWNRFRAIETASEWRQFLGEMLTDWGPSRPSRQRLILVNVPAFYTLETSRDSAYALPENWHTTTDAIAFWLAHQVSAILRESSRGVPEPGVGFSVESTLLKSCKLPAQWTIESLIETEIIDPACGIFADSPVTMDVQRMPS